MPEIRFINGLKKFGETIAVQNINLQVKDKDFVTLLGPSGCGKTTMLRMLAGLESPTEGEIFIDDQCVFSSDRRIDVSPDKRDVGFLFQNYALWPHMTVYKNISFGLENLKWNKSKIEQRVTELLELLKIVELAQRYPAELSGGQQQRVAIARTLAPNPKVLFMDEPLSNLDAKLRMEMRSELKRLHLETNSTFVYVTHDQLEAMTLSTKICLMNEGTIQQYAPPLEVYNNPTNLTVADFVGNPAMNFIKTQYIENKDGIIKMESDDLSFEFTPNTPLTVKIEKGHQLVIGLRPEHIEIEENGSTNSSIYSTLPSGLETVIKLKINNTILTSVAFGGVDYEVNAPISTYFNSNKYILFNKDSRESISMGTIIVKS